MNDQEENEIEVEIREHSDADFFPEKCPKCMLSWFISSGILWSKLLNPASTWGTFINNFLATNAHASVELTSPTTITSEGLSLRKNSSNFIIIFAVWVAWEAEPTFKCISGSGISRS